MIIIIYYIEKTICFHIKIVYFIGIFLVSSSFLIFIDFILSVNQYYISIDESYIYENENYTSRNGTCIYRR